MNSFYWQCFTHDNRKKIKNKNLPLGRWGVREVLQMKIKYYGGKCGLGCFVNFTSVDKGNCENKLI